MWDRLCSGLRQGRGAAAGGAGCPGSTLESGRLGPAQGAGVSGPGRVGWLSSPRGGAAPDPAAGVPLRSGRARLARSPPLPAAPRSAAPAVPYLRRGGFSYPLPSLLCPALPRRPVPSPHGRPRPRSYERRQQVPGSAHARAARGQRSPRPRSALPLPARARPRGRLHPGQSHSRRDSTTPAGIVPLPPGQGRPSWDRAAPAPPSGNGPSNNREKLPLLSSLEKRRLRGDLRAPTGV